jgi:hypothetical protein
MTCDTVLPPSQCHLTSLPQKDREKEETITGMVQNNSKRWTLGEDYRLRELISSKADAFDIASELGRTVSAVTRAVLGTIAQALDEPKSAPDMDRRGYSPFEAFGRSKRQRRFNRKPLKRSVGSVKLKAHWLNLSLARRLKAKGQAANWMFCPSFVLAVSLVLRLDD